MCRFAVLSVFALCAGLANAATGGSGNPEPEAGRWTACATERMAEAINQSGVAASWKRAGALPEGPDVEVVSLPSQLPESTFDSVSRTLYLYPSLGEAYLDQYGGYMGGRVIYGPISVDCP